MRRFEMFQNVGKLSVLTLPNYLLLLPLQIADDKITTVASYTVPCGSSLPAQGTRPVWDKNWLLRAGSCTPGYTVPGSGDSISSK